MTPLIIPDLSHYEPDVDMHAAKAAGVPAIISKCSEGIHSVDPTWHDFYARAHSVPLPIGAYHYLLPGNVQAQMQHFLATANLKPGDLQPIIDAEEPGLGRADTIAALDYLSSHGFRPILYCSLAFWHDVLGSIDTHALWLAAYRPTLPVLPKGVVLFAWQYTDCAHVPGVAKACDASRFYGDLAALQQFCIPQGKAK